MPGPGRRFKPGDPRINRKGRKGSRNKAKVLRERAEEMSRAQQVDARRGQAWKTPLEILNEIANQKGVSKSTRVAAAKAAAPYVHQRMPTAIVVTGAMHSITPEQLANLPDNQLNQLLDILSKVIQIPGAPSTGEGGTAQGSQQGGQGGQ